MISIYLLLDSKKAIHYSQLWASILNNAWGVEPYMERLYWRLNRRWVLSLLSLLILHPRPCSLISWNRAFYWCPDAVLDLWKMYMLQLYRKCWWQVYDKIWLLFFAQSEIRTSHDRVSLVTVGEKLTSFISIYSHFLDSLSTFTSLWLWSYCCQYLEDFLFPTPLEVGKNWSTSVCETPGKSLNKEFNHVM